MTEQRKESGESQRPGWEAGGAQGQNTGGAACQSAERGGRGIWRLAVLAAVFFGLAACCWLKAPDQISLSERRNLAEMPEFSAETVRDGSFMSDFESYSLDQFPWRDGFRSMKALTEYGIFLKKDNNGIYMKDGYAAQILYPYNQKSVEYAAERFRHVYETYLAGSESEEHIFYSVVPDKGYFIGAENEYPSLNYDEMARELGGNMEFAQAIDLTDCLTLEDYYKTDSHWRQERLVKAAQKLGDAMGVSLESLSGTGSSQEGSLQEGPSEDGFSQEGPSELDSSSLEMVTGLTDFRGVYYGQSALPLPGEKLNWLTGPVIEGCTAYDFESGKTLPVYQTEKLEGKDPYDVFLGGARALITVENPAALAAGNDRELILFRDSFGSSMAPLLLEGYGRVTLVDLRYVQADYLGEFLDFHGQDVLFLYGTALLNDSYTIK